MRQRIIFFLLIFAILSSCSVPTATSASIPSGPPHKVIYYHSYKEMCNSTWETRDKRIKVVFGSGEKDVRVSVEGKEYHMDPDTFQYYTGVFNMESKVQGQYPNQLWTLFLVICPDSKTEAWFTLFSGGPVNSETGTLIRIP